MRARQRHFNPKRTAALVLDARYITDADGTAVSTWSDRSGNGRDATQSTSANQPKVKTNGMNGNTTVRFDGAASPNQDSLSISSLSVSQPITAVVAWQGQNSGDYVFDSTSSSNRVIIGFALNSGLSADFGKLGAYAGGAAAIEQSVDSRNQNMIASALFNGSSSLLAKNGTTVATGNPGTANMASLKIGERFANFNNVSQLKGDIGALIILASSSAALRKRIERSMALSFKLACA